MRKEDKRNEEIISNALETDFSLVKDEELLSQVVAKLIAINRIDKTYKLSIDEDTAYYLYLVLCALSEGGYYQYIRTAFSEKTEEAFKKIKANEYGALFTKYNTSLSDEFKNIKGLFKGSKRRKILNKLTMNFKKEWEELDSKKPLVPTYVNPYLKAKVIPLLDKYNTK